MSISPVYKEPNKQNCEDYENTYESAYNFLSWLGQSATSLATSAICASAKAVRSAVEMGVTNAARSVVEMGVTNIEPSVLKRYSSLRKGHEPRVALPPNIGISSPRESGDLNLIPELIDKGYVKKEDGLRSNSCTNRVANLFKRAGMLEGLDEER